MAIEAKTFDEIDGMLMFVQASVREGSMPMVKVIEWLTEVRGELSAYRWVNGEEPPPNMGGQLAMTQLPVVERVIAVKQTLRPVSRMMGFTGDFCSICQGDKMVRNGTCLVCMDCGSTTGCS